MFPHFVLPYLNNGNIQDVENTEWVFQNIKQYMYLRLEKMFKYKQLPETIPPYLFNIMLMNGGFAVLTDKAKEDKSILAFQGGLGGEPDEYYRPTVCIVSNPALSFDEELKIGVDCALIRNDALMIGLDPLLTRYAALMAENIITMKTVDILLRIIGMISAPDDKTKASAEAYLEKLKKGELAVISENRFFDGVKMTSPPANNGTYLTQFIELHQYYKGSLFNELGLQANFNMKRESIGKGEASLSEDILMPLCESMLETRREDFKKFNEMYDQHVEVDFDSAWMNNQKEQFYEMKSLEAESKDTSQLEGGDENVKLGEVSESTEESEDSGSEVNESEDSGSEGNEESEDSGSEDNEGSEDDEKIEEENNSEELGELSSEDASSDPSAVQISVEVDIETGGEDVDGDGKDSKNEEFDSAD